MTFTREEVINLMEKLISDSEPTQDSDKIIYYEKYEDCFMGYYTGKGFEKWCEENIPK